MTKDPMATLGIEYVTDEHGRRTTSQLLGSALVDHRGQIGMASYATLAEIVGGSAFYNAQPAGSATVQSRLSLSVASPVKLGIKASGAGRLVGSTGGHGVTSAELIDDSGAVICVATGRGVVVSRATGETPPLETGRPASSVAPVEQPPLPEPLDPELTGRQILSGLVDGSIPAGPIQVLLGLRVAVVGEDTIELTATPTPGMANKMGTMHGGIVTAILAEAASLGTELSARAGNRYHVADISVSFLRSPAIDQGDLTVTVKQIKFGRRISSVFATMVQPDGTVVAQATADATA
ncbi:PaaI family thioesterase [Nocardia sp. 348MFTsu5.1]|uniref:PaaI family thioesterase n=1 Tax=Nocardia sp. 348MFTsu5.1 TaxID=1172185 RepID=UPI00036575FD|nr:PaaI family thioesterase [Nocardia sp. 348MFTsu5.1]